MMTKEVERFIEKNIDIIEQNTIESWKQIYFALRFIGLTGEFTKAILDAGVNDPAMIMGHIPGKYLSEQEIYSYKIPEGVIRIGSYAFSDCSKLLSIEIPDSVTSIGESAFEDCSSLKSVVIPNSVTEIEPYAFYRCSSLISVEIGDGVITIDHDTFQNCSSLTEIQFKGTKKEWDNIEKGSSWRKNSSLKRIICTDGVLEL